MPTADQKLKDLGVELPAPGQAAAPELSDGEGAEDREESGEEDSDDESSAEGSDQISDDQESGEEASEDEEGESEDEAIKTQDTAQDADQSGETADVDQESCEESGESGEGSEDDEESGDESEEGEGSEQGTQDEKTEGQDQQQDGQDVNGDSQSAVDEDESKPDLSALKGGKVNKAGNVISPGGDLVGRINQGVLRNLIGKGVDENGIIYNDSGKQIGVAELIPDDEREEMMKGPGPFEAFPDAKVDKEGYVASDGERVGKVVEGDAKKLRGMSVDADGDIVDRIGNTLGRAERWEEPEPEKEEEKPKHGAAGRPVNRQGEVCDESGNVIAKLTWGEVDQCAGKEVDGDGDVSNSKGSTIGHVTMIQDIPAEEPEEGESEEDKQKREEAEKEKKLAQQMAYCIQQTLDRVNPICSKITRVRRTALSDVSWLTAL